jgi:hypothetical protein
MPAKNRKHRGYGYKIENTGVSSENGKTPAGRGFLFNLTY